MCICKVAWPLMGIHMALTNHTSDSEGQLCSVAANLTSRVGPVFQTSGHGHLLLVSPLSSVLQLSQQLGSCSRFVRTNNHADPKVCKEAVVIKLLTILNSVV